MKIKCLIVDDEPLAIRLIENHIAKIEALEVVATANSAMKAFEILNNQSVDLLFLDIKMPNITGVDFLKNLKQPPKTIFTTAYRDFAIESYELEVVDYLLKPITFERFFRSVDRYLRMLAPINKAAQLTQNISDFILLKSAGKNYKIALNDIIYIESDKDYIKVHLLDRSSITSKYKISEIDEELPQDRFTRIHRSFIINNNKINAFSATHIEVNSIEIPIGASFREQAQRLIDSLK